jgi:hypothetical protein
MNQSNATAIVSSNADKAGAGRIDAAAQQTDGQVYPEQFEPIFTPGWFSPPEPGDAVEVVMPEGEDLAEFAHDVRYRGQIFDEGHPPPDDFKQPGPNVTRRGYFTRGGHRLIFEDFKGDESLIIREGKAGHEVKLQGSDGTITITNGKSSSKITLKANGDIEIDADAANIDAKCATFTAEASVKAHLKAPLTDLSDVSPSPVIKGTEFNAAVAALHTKWTDFLAKLAPVQVEWAGFATSGLPWIPVVGTQNQLATALSGLSAAISTYAAAVAGFTSAKTKTG